MNFIISLLIAGALYQFIGMPESLPAWPFYLLSALPLIETPFLLTYFTYRSSATQAVSFSRKREFFWEDRKVQGALILLGIIPLFQIVLIFVMNSFPIAIYGWFILFAGAIDLLFVIVKKFTQLETPSYLVDEIKRGAIRAIKNDDLGMLTLAFSDLFEMSRLSEKMKGNSLFLQAVAAIRDTTASFFARATSLPHLTEEIEMYEKNNEDPLSYILLSVIKQLEGLCKDAIEQKETSRLMALFSTIARIGISAGTLDATLSLYPIDLLGKEALEAEKADLRESALKGQLLLIEIVKEMGQKSDIAYQEVKTPFLALIGFVRAVSEDIFRKNRQTSIKMLKAPFEELKAIFTQSPWKDHPDTPLLLGEIEKTEASFSALETILLTMPIN